MASSDEHPGVMPTSTSHDEEDTNIPGKPMTVGSQMIDKGATMLQSMKPVRQMHQHVCTFALYSHDMTRQIETHHYITRLNQDFLQCAVYDTDDSNARLIGKSDHFFNYYVHRSQFSCMHASISIPCHV